MCPFCGKTDLEKKVKVFPNLPLQRLFDQELIKVEGKIDEKEKERLQKIEANKLLQEQVLKIHKNLGQHAFDPNIDPSKDENEQV